jgi:triosephosphate isomerase
MKMIEIKTPVLMINFKAYEESLGDNALKIAKICEKISIKENVSIVICPQFTDIQMIAKKVKIPVFAQHIDPIEPGAFTGHISALSIKKAGASGTLLNHSEKKMNFDDIMKCIEIAKRYELITVCCEKDETRAKSISQLNPNFIAIEPPELIGGDVSVSKAKPEVIINGVKACGKIPVLVGAGIKNKEDVEKAIELGANGVLLASGVVKAEDKKKAILELVSGMKNACKS